MEEETIEFALDCSLPRKPDYKPWRRFSDDPPYFNAKVLATGKKRTFPNTIENWWIGIFSEKELYTIEEDEIWWVYPPSEIERLGEIAKHA